MAWLTGEPRPRIEPGLLDHMSNTLTTLRLTRLFDSSCLEVWNKNWELIFILPSNLKWPSQKINKYFVAFRVF